MIHANYLMLSNTYTCWWVWLGYTCRLICLGYTCRWVWLGYTCRWMWLVCIHLDHTRLYHTWWSRTMGLGNTLMIWRGCVVFHQCFNVLLFFFKTFYFKSNISS